MTGWDESDNLDKNVMAEQLGAELDQYPFGLLIRYLHMDTCTTLYFTSADACNQYVWEELFPLGNQVIYTTDYMIYMGSR